ncbi:MAG: CheW domain-containing protein [Moorea sp. SIO1F2]|uniref:chemotaxis protein CheW n=1 Tax=unclassified Moorena TaxID=2683338 RepID=UPI0013B824DB|nr:MULTISPECIES: chemotaxis protein CheW [unclassified Moorena]NEO01886.1 CheW domain-containing protein [Moorena sp. SIO3I7]NEO09083.1 CheW domain-containing protein [Moorena sp. SIO3I8]NEO21763.1 CheW domain-containing protein [Moorena sp. SIO4A5]NEP20729.1 CheW domain-containing protein [Moorena sp. SIO3I6]NEQ60753.1 CheW domain-containing protein [Moorena sp. SIO4A1]
MKNNLIDSQLSDSNRLQNQNTTSFLKLVVFRIDSINFAFPIECVKKVINYTTVYSSGLNDIGIAHIDDQEIPIIDLHRRLFKSSKISTSNPGRFLLIAQNTMGERFGIPVLKTPNLIEVSVSDIRTLPESFRQADTLGIASHVAVIPQENTSLTVFLLDVNQLLPWVSQSAKRG